MAGMLDVHQHLIYGMDDGAQNREDMLAMLRQAAEQQVTDVVCTPHAVPGQERFHLDRYHRHLEEARGLCQEHALPLKLHTGAEILYTRNTPRMLQEGEIPTLAGSSVALVEFSPDDSFRHICQAAEALATAGYTMLLAHVERYGELRKLSRLQQLKDEYGVLLQMNARTVFGAKGFLFARWVRKMLDEGYVDCVASDAHHAVNRSCRLKDAHSFLAERYGRDEADQMCGGFQREILGL